MLVLLSENEVGVVADALQEWGESRDISQAQALAHRIRVQFEQETAADVVTRYIAAVNRLGEHRNSCRSCYGDPEPCLYAQHLAKDADVLRLETLRRLGEA